MYKNLRWKFLTILAVTAIAFAFFWPPWKKVHRGLDLQGGLHMILQVHTDDAVRLETETTADQVREALKAKNITVGSVRATSMTQFVIDGIAPETEQQVRQVADDQSGASFTRSSVGSTSTFTMKPNVERDHRVGAVTQSIQTIDRRINELGVSEPLIAPYGTRGDEIIVELPG